LAKIDKKYLVLKLQVIISGIIAVISGIVDGGFTV
jgi:hypothetical protein